MNGRVEAVLNKVSPRRRGQLQSEHEALLLARETAAGEYVDSIYNGPLLNDHDNGEPLYILGNSPGEEDLNESLRSREIDKRMRSERMDRLRQRWQKNRTKLVLNGSAALILGVAGGTTGYVMTNHSDSHVTRGIGYGRDAGLGNNSADQSQITSPERSIPTKGAVLYVRGK